MAVQLAEQSSASLLPATGLVSITRALERGLGAIVSAAAALLVVA